MKSTLYIKHDLYAVTDINIMKLIEKFHEAGYGIWWAIVELLTQEQSHILSKELLISNVKTVLRAKNTTTISAVIDFCIELGILKENEGLIFNERIIRQCDDLDKISKQNSENCKKRWENEKKPQKTNENDTTVEGANTSVESGTTNKIKENKIKENKIKENKIKENKDNTLSFETKVSSDNVCSEANKSLEADDKKDPVFVEIPKIDGGTFQVLESQVKKWEDTFLAIDVRQQIRNAKSWIECNPKKGKSDIKRFLNTWLTNEQDKGGKGAYYRDQTKQLLKSSVCTAGAFEGQKNAQGGFDL